MRAFPGDTVQIRVRSELPNNVKNGRDDATSLALHGIRLTAATDKGGLHSRLAGPQLAIHTFTVDKQHAPGLHWYSVGGGLGFMGALYVLSADADAASQSKVPGSRLLVFESQGAGSTYFINGGDSPAPLNVRSGESQQLDLAYASGPDLLDIVAGKGCELELLAIDGVDLNEPRDVDYVPLVSRQRARVALTCQESGESALLARPRAHGIGSKAPKGQDSAQDGMQRLLAVSVFKAKGLPFSRLPRVVAPRPFKDTALAGATYLKDLASENSVSNSCTISLYPCHGKAFCSADRSACLTSPSTSDGEVDAGRLGAAYDIDDFSAQGRVRELFVHTKIAAQGASLRLSPPQHFQVLDFIPDEEEAVNPYLAEWGAFGEWRDVFPPLKGTFRVRYQAREEHDHEGTHVEYDGFQPLGNGQREDEAALGGDRRDKRSHRASWTFPGTSATEKPGDKNVEFRDAYLLVQATVGETDRDPAWVETSIKAMIQEDLVEEEEPEPDADDDTIMPAEHMPTIVDKHEPNRGGERRDSRENKSRETALETNRLLLAIGAPSTLAVPVQMPRRYLPAASLCNDSALVWPTAFTLHLRNSSSIYSVVDKLNELLQPKHGEDERPQLCTVNVTLLSSVKAAAFTTGGVAAIGKNNTKSAPKRMPSHVVILLGFLGGACILFASVMAVRRFMAPAGPPRSSRRSSVHHDPTTIETQITELDDSTSLGVKSSALRHSSRARTNSLTGVNLAILPPARLSAGNIAATPGGGGLGGSLSGTRTMPQHYRSSSSLPTDLAAFGHGRSSSMPLHGGAGLLPSRKQSIESINISNSGALGASLGSDMEHPEAAERSGKGERSRN